MIADHLRLEVQPLGANVMMIVTGAVVSKGQTYFSDFALPENSLYKRIEGTIAARARGEDGVPRMPTNEYAAPVVDEIAKRNSGKFWYGEYADMVKAVMTPNVAQEVLVSSGSSHGASAAKLTFPGCGRCTGNWTRHLEISVERHETSLEVEDQRPFGVV
jgi:hypothetical protein